MIFLFDVTYTLALNISYTSLVWKIMLINTFWYLYENILFILKENVDNINLVILEAITAAQYY